MFIVNITLNFSNVKCMCVIFVCGQKSQSHPIKLKLLKMTLKYLRGMFSLKLNYIKLSEEIHYLMSEECWFRMLAL